MMSQAVFVVDYFRHPEVIKLNSTTPNAVIFNLKSIFSHHGVPSMLISDNGSLFDSIDIKKNLSTSMVSHMLQAALTTHRAIAWQKAQ